MNFWWFVVGAGAFIIFALLLLFLIFAFRRFSFMKKLKGYNKYLYAGALILPPVLFFVYFMLDKINALMVLLHFVIICVICDFVFFVIRKIKKRGKYKRYYSGFLALCLTIIYLGIGLVLCFNVWKTQYSLTTSKNIDEPLTIIQFADSHMGTTFDGDEFAYYVDEMSQSNPDIVVITGDFVDDDTTKEDMIKACSALSRFNTKYGVYFVFGNHDRGYYNTRDFTGNDLILELEKNGVMVLEDEVVEIGKSYYLVGRADKSKRTRKSISELTDGLDKDRYIIVLNHQPNDYENEKEAKVDLVLSGHTHGGQLFPIGIVGVMSGANDKTYGYEKRDSTDFIVTSGISDWAIKFKTFTKSEYVYISISK